MIFLISFIKQFPGHFVYLLFLTCYFSFLLHRYIICSKIRSMSGIINISKLKIPPERHELDVAKYFSELGYDIEFIAPSKIPDIHTPDI